MHIIFKSFKNLHFGFLNIWVHLASMIGNTVDWKLANVVTTSGSASSSYTWATDGVSLSSSAVKTSVNFIPLCHFISFPITSSTSGVIASKKAYAFTSRWRLINTMAL